MCNYLRKQTQNPHNSSFVFLQFRKKKLNDKEEKELVEVLKRIKIFLDCLRFQLVLEIDEKLFGA